MFYFNKKSGKSLTSLLAITLGTTVLLSACGGHDHEEVTPVDKLEEATEMAKAKKPEPEVLELETVEVAEDASAEEATETGDTSEEASSENAEEVTEAEAITEEAEPVTEENADAEAK